MTASLSAPPRLSVVKTAPKVTPDPELTQMIASAKGMSARALSLQIEAGRVLGSAQALNKKQYAAEMVNFGLDKTQGNKLIAAAAAADAMPSADVGAFLSPHLLIQLGQKRNQAALDAITDDDNQLSVVEKIKKYRTPSAPKEKKSVRRVGNLKGGTPKLVIEVPPGPHVEEIYSDYEKSGTHVAQWLGGLVNRDHDSFLRSPEYSSPNTQVASAPEPNSELDVLGATPDTQLNTPSPAPENLTEQDVSQAEFNEYVDNQAQSIALETQNEVSPRTSPSIAHDAIALPSPILENSTEQEAAQAEFNEYVDNQAQSIALETQNEVFPRTSPTIAHNAIALPSPSVTNVDIAMPELGDVFMLGEDRPLVRVTRITKAGNVTLLSGKKLQSKHPLQDLYGCYCLLPIARIEAVAPSEVAATQMPAIESEISVKTFVSIEGNQQPEATVSELRSASDHTQSTPLPSPTADNLTELEAYMAELDAYVKAQAERIAPEPTTFPLPSPINDAVAMPEVRDELHWSDRPEASVTGINEEIPNSPFAKIESIKETSPTLPSSPPSTDRYKLGWREGDKVVANSVVQKSYEWAEGKPMTITSVEGKVGTIQTLNAIRHDGHEQMSFGNWVEEVPSESVALPSPHQPEATQTVFFEIGKTGDNWEGEIVQLVSKGSVHYHVKRLNDDTWTHILPKLLCEVSHESGVAARTALTEKVFKEYGLQVGDAITWSVEDIPLTGTIVHLTKLGAFIDEGQPGLAWVKYHRLFKILSDEDAISVEHQVVDSQQVACSPDAEDVPATETEYEYLSAALKKAATWLEVADLVERDSARLAKAVKQWSDREKNRLVDYLTSYLKSDPDALLMQKVDWLPVASLEKSFKQLSYKVKNIQKGLTAPCINGCQFIKVKDFGNDSEEIWTFFDPTSSQNIKVCDRKDIQVIAF